MFYYQLGVTAHFQLISFHGVGEVKPNYDSFIFGLVIGGLEDKSKGVFHIYLVWRGQDQTCTASLGIGGPVYGQPPDREVGRQLSSFGRLCWGEFHDEIYRDLPFYYCPWFVFDVELTQLYSPLYQSFRGFWFMQYFLHRIFSWDFDGMSLEVRSELSRIIYQR